MELPSDDAGVEDGSLPGGGQHGHPEACSGDQPLWPRQTYYNSVLYIVHR